MRVVLFVPKKELPLIVQVPSDPRIALGDRVNSRQVYFQNQELMLVDLLDAESTGQLPNRIVDGKLIYGPFLICMPDFKELPYPVAGSIRDNAEDWPMAQLEVYDKPA